MHFKYDATQEIWCEVTVLDDFLPNLMNLSFIKSDIEGADLLALRRAEKLIERHRPTVVCEINP
ncbi:MAG: FkbM family methyltransferase [Deltaproteobacteria bacterium]|nr:FkbM family methyltransferase [Deltaproteobacteria bacterium]